MALGLAVIGWYGYDATASSQGIDATKGLMLTMVWLPFGLALAVIFALALSPINARRHRIIRRRLDSLQYVPTGRWLCPFKPKKLIRSNHRQRYRQL